MTWKTPGKLTSRNGFYGTGRELKTHKTGKPGTSGVHNCNTFPVTRRSTSPQRPWLNPKAIQIEFEVEYVRLVPTDSVYWPVCTPQWMAQPSSTSVSRPSNIMSAT